MVLEMKFGWLNHLEEIICFRTYEDCCGLEILLCYRHITVQIPIPTPKCWYLLYLLDILQKEKKKKEKNKYPKPAFVMTAYKYHCLH
jgi:hypothetical protein